MERSTCMKCGKKRYRKYMKLSGEYDRFSGLQRWVCKGKCSGSFYSGHKSRQSFWSDFFTAGKLSVPGDENKES